MQDGECGEDDVFAVSFLTCHPPLHYTSDDASPVAPSITKLAALSALHQRAQMVSPQKNKHHICISTVRIRNEA